MIRRRGLEIIQFFGEDTFSSVWRNSKEIFFIRNNDNLDQLLQRFWENEKFPNKTRTIEEILCEWHFEKLTARNETGRYTEKLPRREGQNRLRGFIWRSKTIVSTARATLLGTSRREYYKIIQRNIF